MADDARLPDPRTAGEAAEHLKKTIEEAKQAARAAMDANEPPGAERIPEQDEYTPTSGGDFPLGMSETLGRAADRMRHANQASEADESLERAEPDE